MRFLQDNQDVFAWSHADMVEIDPNIMNHALNIDSKFLPKQQTRRSMDDERKKALKKEVDRLSEKKFIRKAYYLTWIVNPVLVPKPIRK